MSEIFKVGDRVQRKGDVMRPFHIKELLTNNRAVCTDGVSVDWEEYLSDIEKVSDAPGKTND